MINDIITQGTNEHSNLFILCPKWGNCRDGWRPPILRWQVLANQGLRFHILVMSFFLKVLKIILQTHPNTSTIFHYSFFDKGHFINSICSIKRMRNMMSNTRHLHNLDAHSQNQQSKRRIWTIYRQHFSYIYTMPMSMEVVNPSVDYDVTHGW